MSVTAQNIPPVFLSLWWHFLRRYSLHGSVSWHCCATVLSHGTVIQLKQSWSVTLCPYSLLYDRIPCQRPGSLSLRSILPDLLWPLLRDSIRKASLRCPTWGEDHNKWEQLCLVGGRAQTQRQEVDKNGILARIDLLFRVSINTGIIKQFTYF